MLIILPAAAFAAILFFVFQAEELSGDKDVDWRGRLLLAAVIWGSAVVVLTEGLSLLRLINRTALTIGWVAVAGLFLYLGLRSQNRKKKSLGGGGRSWKVPALSLDWIPAAAMVVLAGMLAYIAVVSPSNTIDSLHYHMSRVMHWAQNGSLRFYPVYYEPQLYNPIWAEITILNLRVLAGGDWPANLVQWASMAGTILGVTQVTRMLGGSRRAQMLSAVFAFSIPMGVLQATSTQTDYVTTFWFITTIFLVLLSTRRELTLMESVYLGAAVGLGMLTKVMYYFFAFPVVLWFVFTKWKRSGFMQLLKRGLLITAVVFAMNAGYWTRNLATYHFPIGPTRLLEEHSTSGRTPGGVVLNMLEHIGQNFSTQRSDVNTLVQNSVDTAAQFLGDEDYEFTVYYAWNHEDLAGNPIHYALFFFTLGLLLLAARKLERSQQEKQLTWVLIGSALFFMFMLESYTHVTRHHLTFLAGWSILFGLVIDRLFPRSLTFLGMLVLVYLSSRHVLYNRSRPLIGDFPVTSSDSILLEEPRVILFTNLTEQRKVYFEGTAAALEIGCSDVGMVIDSHDPEYALWWLMDAPQNGMRLEHIIYPEHLEPFVDPEFMPCMIVCTLCSEDDGFEGYEPYAAFDFFRIYAATDLLEGF